MLVLLLVSMVPERSPVLGRAAAWPAGLGGVPLRVGHQTALPAGFSRLLLPLSYAAIFGGVTTLVSVVVMTFCVRFLPAHDAGDRELQQAYFLEAQVESGSTMIGRSIEKNRLRSLKGRFLLEIVRDGCLISPVTPMPTLEAGDTLIFTGEVDKVQALQRFDGLPVSIAFGATVIALVPLVFPFHH